MAVEAVSGAEGQIGPRIEAQVYLVSAGRMNSLPCSPHQEP